MNADLRPSLGTLKLRVSQSSPLLCERAGCLWLRPLDYIPAVGGLGDVMFTKHTNYEIPAAWVYLWVCFGGTENRRGQLF